MRDKPLIRTCVSMDCPFIDYCKNYKLTEDRGERCETQERILRAAEVLSARKKQKH